MSVQLLEAASAALDTLVDEVVFLGAATLPIWITDRAAPPLRPTADVDVVVEATTRIAYDKFEQKLRDRGFRDDGKMVGRFRFGPDDLQLDAIPADASILGFDNRWQRAGLRQSVTYVLPSGTKIRVLPPAYLLATKLEAFSGRGTGDYLGSADFEDIVALVDGREELVADVSQAPADVRTYVAEELTRLLTEPRARDAIVAHLEVDRDGRERSREVVTPRIERIAGLMS